MELVRCGLGSYRSNISCNPRPGDPSTAPCRSIEINALQCPPNVHNVLATATEILLTKLSQASLNDTTELPQYVVVLENWLMIELEHQNTLTQRLMEVLHHLPETVRTSLCSVLKT